MWFGVITLFPELIDAFALHGVFGRAVSKGIIRYQCFNPRDYSNDKHRRVDDRPFGGGPGMVLSPDPIHNAILDAKNAQKPSARVVHLSPQGAKLTQKEVKRLLGVGSLILLAGRYEGIDERIIQLAVDEEISLGDYVLSGGELPAMVLMDAVSRLVPGVLGHAESALEDSFSDGLLDCPHYTRPEIYGGLAVPEVLLGGNHAKIASWRLKEKLGRTYLRRPDLFNASNLTEQEKKLLNEYLLEHSKEVYTDRV